MKRRKKPGGRGGNDYTTDVTFTPTGSSIVLSYSELVEVSCITNGEFIIIGVHGFLSVLHVDSQLVATLSSNLLDVV